MAAGGEKRKRLPSEAPDNPPNAPGQANKRIHKEIENGDDVSVYPPISVISGITADTMSRLDCRHRLGIHILRDGHRDRKRRMASGQ